jgi:hypothetical protein
MMIVICDQFPLLRLLGLRGALGRGAKRARKVKKKNISTLEVPLPAAFLCSSCDCYAFCFCACCFLFAIVIPFFLSVYLSCLINSVVSRLLWTDLPVHIPASQSTSLRYIIFCRVLVPTPCYTYPAARLLAYPCFSLSLFSSLKKKGNPVRSV